MKIKKISFFVFSLVLLIILLPSNVFADSFSFWRVPYKNTNYNSYDTRYGYYGSRSGDLNAYTDYTTTIYFTNSSFTSNIYDYVEIPISISVDSPEYVIESETFTLPNANTMYYVMNNFNFQLGITYSNGNYDAYASCTISSYNYSNHEFTGIATCPVNRVADGVRYIQLKHNLKLEMPTSSNIYQLFFGTNGWFNFIYKNDNSGSIVNAINNQTNSINNSQSSTTNAINNTTNAINGVNDSITDSTGNTNADNQSAINDFSSKLATNNTISSLVTLPITLFQKILNSINGTCHSFSLGTLLGTEIILPCINPQNYLGSTLWNTIDIICSGVFVFGISKKFREIWDNFTNLKGGKDVVS